MSGGLSLNRASLRGEIGQFWAFLRTWGVWEISYGAKLERAGPDFITEVLRGHDGQTTAEETRPTAIVEVEI